MVVVFVARAMLNSSTANLIFLHVGLMAVVLSNAVQLRLAKLIQSRALSHGWRRKSFGLPAAALKDAWGNGLA